MVVTRLGVESLDRQEPGTLRNRKYRQVCIFWEGSMVEMNLRRGNGLEPSIQQTDVHLSSSTFIHPADSESTGAGEGERDTQKSKCLGKLQSLR